MATKLRRLVRGQGWVSTKPPNPCRVCGAFIPYPGMGRPRHYCDACRPTARPIAATWERWYANGGREHLVAYQRQSLGYRQMVEAPCSDCGLSVRSYTDGRCPPCREKARKLAANPPRSVTCPRCGVAFQTRRGRHIYCSGRCRGRFLDSGRLQPQWRRRILNRDGWVCYLCSKPIAKNLPWPHPFYGTVDHVVPRSAGGSNDPSNLRAAHWRCNEEKGDALPGVEVWVPMEVQP